MLATRSFVTTNIGKCLMMHAMFDLCKTTQVTALAFEHKIWARHMESWQALRERCQDGQQHQDPHSPMWCKASIVCRPDGSLTDAELEQCMICTITVTESSFWRSSRIEQNVSKTERISSFAEAKIYCSQINKWNIQDSRNLREFIRAC
jgi:hypothetical protein